MALEDYSPRSRPDAIFIWNCFEQMNDPSAALKSSRELLDRHGLLIIRVPNANFYLRQRSQLGGSSRTLKMLGYNNLLGFPYLHGYKQATLEGLLRAHGFEPVSAHSSSLLTPPYPHISRRLRAEWHEARRQAERSSANNSPWLELVSRRTAD